MRPLRAKAAESRRTPRRFARFVFDGVGFAFGPCEAAVIDGGGHRSAATAALAGAASKIPVVPMA